MTTIAGSLAQRGFILRSGGAEGADSAFEAGVPNHEQKEIYLPWRGFNRSISSRYTPSVAALAMAETFHPAWGRCSPAARKLHARNCHQVLGANLDSPSLFLLCWTASGEPQGGTGQAMRIAIAHNIPIFNLGRLDALDKIGAFLCQWE
jgi:hypothetical protein